MSQDYSNYFLINSYDLSNNETALNEICDYAAEADLHFTVYFFSLYNSTWKIEWVEAASHRWGEKFLGVYLRDEPGGRQIDLMRQSLSRQTLATPQTIVGLFLKFQYAYIE